MRKEFIEHARNEAAEFIMRANAVLEESNRNGSYYPSGTKKTGGLRRQSLELSRALAEMRKP